MDNIEESRVTESPAILPAIDKALRSYVKTLRCAGCLQYGSDPHHVKSRGAGGIDAGNLVPLCRKCHTEIHAKGRETWQRENQTSLWEVAANVYARYVTGRWISMNLQ